MIEYIIINILLTKEFFNKYYNYLDLDFYKNNNREVYKIFLTLQQLHSENQAPQFSTQELALYFFTQYSALKTEEREMYDLLFKRVEEVVYDESIASDYLEKCREKVLSSRIAIAALDVSQGRGELTTIIEMLEEYKEQPAAAEEFEFLTGGELTNETFRKMGLRWRLMTLNKSLGSLRRGDFGFVFARPESFSRDTEVLTPLGWLAVDKVTLSTEVAQVDSERNISFTTPLSVNSHEQEECIRIHDILGRVDLIVTKGHQMVYEQQGILKKERADTVKYYQWIKHHTSGIIHGQRELSFYERFLIAYQADGYSKFYQNKNGNWVGFLKFQKQRKIDRLTWILDNLPSCTYAKYKRDKRDQIEFRVVLSNQIYKDFSWVNLGGIDSTWGGQFLQEVANWDGSVRTATRFKYDTTNKSCADIVQAIAVMSGYSVFHSVRSDNRKDSYNNVHSLNLRSNYTPVDGQCIKKEVISFTDTTYCFTVPTGMLLVRRNGATAICGNTGKTTFLASEVTYMAGQLDSPVLWFNNEEDGSKVIKRCIQSALGISQHELEANLESSKSDYFKLTNQQIYLYDSGSINRSTVERICKQYEPGLIVFDQLDKITGFDADRYDLKMKAIYQWARELAKSYCPVIGVCQASGGAEGKTNLTMTDVDSSWTAKQSECDFIIGIGASNDVGQEYSRHLNILKNKLDGDGDSIESLRHGRLPATIIPVIGRYEDVLKWQ